jgi:hypothetical protein
MAKNKVGSIVVIQREFFSSDLKRILKIGEKAVVMECKDPPLHFENYGKMLTLLIDGRVTSMFETYVKFLNFKFPKSEKNLERVKIRAELKKKKREEREKND